MGILDAPVQRTFDLDIALTGRAATNATAIRTALKNARNGQKVRVACVGDSITYGYNVGGISSSTGALKASGNLVAVMRDCLNALGTPAYQGMSNAGAVTTAGSSTIRPWWTVGTGWSIAAGYGLPAADNGVRNGAASAAGTLDFGPVTCDSFVVKWMRRASTSTFDIWVDAGAHTSTGGSGTDAVQYTTISAGSLGSHTLHVGNIGAGSQGAIIMAVEPVVSTGGLHIGNYGSPSATAANFTVTGSAWAPLNYVWDADQPALTVLGVGTNDWLTASNRTPTQLQADMVTLISKAKTYGGVLVWIPLQRGDTANLNSSYTWPQYVAAIKAACTAQGVPCLDFGTYLGGTTASAQGGRYDSGDSVHPGTEGHYEIGRALARALLATV